MGKDLKNAWIGRKKCLHVLFTFESESCGVFGRLLPMFEAYYVNYGLVSWTWVFQTTLNWKCLTDLCEDAEVRRRIIEIVDELANRRPSKSINVLSHRASINSHRRSNSARRWTFKCIFRWSSPSVFGDLLVKFCKKNSLWWVCAIANKNMVVNWNQLSVNECQRCHSITGVWIAIRRQLLQENKWYIKDANMKF